jgi:hypothetical protein
VTVVGSEESLTKLQWMFGDVEMPKAVKEKMV